jgi:hypothetical protein
VGLSYGLGSMSRLSSGLVPDKKNLEPATLSHKKVAFVFEPRDSCHQLQLQRDSSVRRANIPDRLNGHFS